MGADGAGQATGGVELGSEMNDGCDEAKIGLGGAA